MTNNRDLVFVVTDKADVADEDSRSAHDFMKQIINTYVRVDDGAK